MRERLISKKKQYLLTIVMMTLLVFGMIPGITKVMIVRAETTTSTITVDGTDYTLFTGFTATGGNGNNWANLVDGNTSTDWMAGKTENYTPMPGEPVPDPDASPAPTGDFAGGTEDPAFVEFHADAPIIPKGYVLTCDHENAGFWKPVEWALKAKLNEGDEWTTIHYSTTTLGQGKTFEIPCTNDQNNKYQYFRFEVYEVGATTMLRLDELEFYGFTELTYTHLTVRDATCREMGIKQECYKRNDGKYFTDENGTAELNESDVIVPMIAHTGVHYEADENHVEYWQCSVCGKYFSNEACSNEITELQTQIVKYLATDGTLKTLDSVATAVTSTMTSWSNGWYVVYDDVTISDRISVSGTVHLILCNGATLTASEGITVGSSATFNVYAQTEDEATMGALTATAKKNSYNSAIGGCEDTSLGTININGGKITATTNINSGAPIGGGYNTNGGNITINGGIITATAGECSFGAGIGGGNNGYVSTITLNGGTIYATGDTQYGGAGIGTGSYAGSGNMTITITNGIKSIIATKGYNSDCIGKESHSETAVNVVFKHDETELTTDEQKAEYFTVIEGNRLIIVQKVTPAIVDVPDQTYTGSEITPEPLVMAGSLNLTKGTDYEYSYESNINVGTAKVTVTFKGDYASLGSVEKEFNIVNLTSKNVSDIAAQTYTGSAIEPKVTVTDDETTLVLGKDYTVSYSDNTNAGTAKAIITGIGNYSGTVEKTFTINKATPTVTVPEAVENLVYNGEEQELVTEGSTNFGKVLYSLDGTNYSENIPKTKNVGNYIVSYTVEGTDNWNKVEAQSITVTIGKATPTVTSPTAKTLTYTGSGQELVTAGSTNFGTLLYSLDGETYFESIPKAINAGDYTVYYKVEGTSNWNAVEAKTVKVSIAPKPISPTIKLSYTSTGYDKTEKKPVVTVTDEESIIKDGMYSISYSEDCVNAGEKSVTVTDIKGDNYEIVTTKAKYNITPKEVSLKWENLSFTYDGTVKTPSATAGGVISGDSCDVTVTGGQIKAGSYTATAESLSNSNYSLPADKTIAFRINKATTTPNTPEQTMEVDYSVKTAGDITLPDDWVLSESDKEKDFVVGANTVTAVYTGSDKGNYETESVAIEVTRAECKHTGMVATEAKARTCKDAGNTAYWYCPECGRYYSDSKGETEMAKDSWVLEALGHEYGEPIYTWSDDGKTCTAKATCTREGCKDDTEGHTVTETVQSTGKETKAATCEEKGITTYTATFENESFETQTKEVADIDAKGHRYGITTYEWSEDGKTCTATSVCSNDSTHKITETATYEPDKADSQIKATVKEAATTEKMGTTTYTATFKNAEMFKVQTKDVVDIPKVEVTDNPSDNPSDNPTDKPSDNPSKPTDTTNPTDTTKPSDTTKTDGNTSSNDNTKDTPVTPAPKEEGAKLPVTDTKAEYVVTSKAGEEPAVEYKPASDAKEKTVTVPESVTVDGVTYAVNEIADNAFKGNKTVESVVIPKSVKEIGDSAFSGCTNLKSVTIPESVTEIGDKAFSGCKKLKSVTIGKNVAEIGDSAFANCSALTKATLPANVTKLGSNIFKGCKNLKTITFKTIKLTSKNIAKNALKGIGKR